MESNMFVGATNKKSMSSSAFMKGKGLCTFLDDPDRPIINFWLTPIGQLFVRSILTTFNQLID